MRTLSEGQANVLFLSRGGSPRQLKHAEPKSLGSHILLAAAVTLQRWRNQAAQRRVLAGMSDYHLKDLGLSRADVEGEAAKRFWQS